MDRGMVQRWLRQVLEPVAYDDGRAALLLLLDGTLPAEYGGVVYYIPVHIWIPRAYPREAPTVYVMPTKDMLVRRSAYVDPSGRVYAEYMQQWERKPEGADILDLLRACQGHFGQEPPVVAKPTAAGPSQVAAQPPPATAGSAGSPRPAAQPARPPNPELAALHDAVYTKFRTRRDELRHSVSQANAQLRVLLDDLERGQPAIQDEMQRLEAVQAVCNTRTHQLNDTMQAAQSRAHELQLRPEPNVDEMFAATNLVENQLVQLVAEDHAIEDTLYQLGRALHAEQLSLDRFIKQTRMLSREQFLRRALAKKIVHSLGWT
ncbi:suppressor protein stp22 of temperature-sensitive alpha-factor receptor and arginine permease [Malassezia japonica]|uniref:Suppressor protein stp22 of temperature-sensitive alpha-factor receptor and arginine permease n=1 Tax=Malassezia japonica TaxID=223818 RepID=A0AAF0EZ14_9BASI|nr:suppressor protein stp22 of temperature-sensitive alpha-factor receptor and arginine permease [Malassezia japonica]WFD39768.1 suppressor protein stp22 of temperature-sensitive alpha-factor receptor and arginine permease [Malassezia japonica]